MIHAYNKEYVSDAMENLGEAFDYAVHAQNLSLNQFSSLFINSNASKSFENGNPKYVSGISGTELVLTILNQTGLQPKQHKSLTDYDRSSEYWTGWILAYYQWYSGKSFEIILKYLPAQEINKMYYPLHEAPEQKFIEIANKIIFEKAKSSRLQELRKMAGLTQKKLADLSGVNLRTLQQYENQSKDINKASANTLLSLCKVLACDVEDICM